MKVSVHILRERCKGCGICVSICQTKVLVLSEEKNRSGCSFPVALNPEACLLCGMCEMFCPDFAVWVEKQRKEAGP